MSVKRGEIYYADLSPVVGSEQGGMRPVLIVQNDVGNRHSPTVIAAAITSQRDKTHLPTHIEVQADKCGLSKDSIVLLSTHIVSDIEKCADRVVIIKDGQKVFDGTEEETGKDLESFYIDIFGDEE